MRPQGRRSRANERHHAGEANQPIGIEPFGPLPARQHRRASRGVYQEPRAELMRLLLDATPDMNSTCQRSPASGRHEVTFAPQQRCAPACLAA